MKSRVGDLLVRNGSWYIPGVAVVIDVDDDLNGTLCETIHTFTITPALQMSVMGKTRSIQTTHVGWYVSSNYVKLETGDV